MITCEYSARCWRYSYSRRLLDRSYEIPPDRVTMLCDGYATFDMMPKGGLYAEHMPLVRDGQLINLCPAMQNQPLTSCPEHQKEARRLASLAKAREHSRQYFDARKRVWIAPEVRQAVAHRYHYTCVYCHRSHNQLWKGKKLKGHVDHYIPLALGGNEVEPSNLVFACEDCNQAKGANVWQFGCRIGYYQEC